MKISINALAVASLIVLFLFPASNSEAQNNADDIIVIANNRVPIDAISIGELKALYMKRRTKWNDGTRAVPIHAKEGTLLRQVFLEKVIGMTLEKELLFWQNQKIKKGIGGPPEFSNTQKATFSIRGSISYVKRSDHREGVTKTLLVIPR